MKRHTYMLGEKEDLEVTVIFTENGVPIITKCLQYCEFLSDWLPVTKAITDNKAFRTKVAEACAEEWARESVDAEHENAEFQAGKEMNWRKA